MFQNVQWKLLTVIVIIAIAVVITILGFPGNSGFLGLNLRFGTDLRGGSRLVYTLQNVEVKQINVNILGERNTLREDIVNLREISSGEYDDMMSDVFGVSIADPKIAVKTVDHEKLNNLYKAFESELADLDQANDKELVDAIEKIQKDSDTLMKSLQDLKRINDKFNSEKKTYVNKVCDVLRNRLDASKLGGIVVRPYGEDRVQIILPEAIRNEENIKKIIKASGQIFWRIEAPNKYRDKVTYPNFPADAEPNEYRWYPIEKETTGDGFKAPNEWDTQGSKKWMLIGWSPKESKVRTDFLSGENLEKVNAASGSMRELQVYFKFKPQYTNMFSRFTAQYKVDNYQSKTDAPRLCVIFNEKVFWAGTIQNQLDGEGVMTGFDSKAEQEAMVNLLSSGSLPVTLVEEGDSTTGAELGQNSIRQGIVAILIGGILVLVFILFYYLGAGLIANFGLISNLFLLLGIMVLFQATLTLPGIAGIILTIGMSIDANILIFERIREEKRKTGNLKDAIQRGFDRAIVTILDAQITTILTAFILALVGTAEIQGFAITLIIGIAASLFTSLLVTRFLIGYLVGLNVIKKFAMLQMIGEPKLKFLNLRAPMFSISTILIIIGLFVFTVRGSENLGIDFLGGMEFHVALEEPTDVNNVREGFAELKDDNGNPKYPNVRIIAAYPEGVISSGTHTSQFVITFPSKGEDANINREIDKRNKKSDIERIFNGDKLPRLVQSGVEAYIGKASVAQFKIIVPFRSELAPDKQAFINSELPVYLNEIEMSDGTLLESVIEQNKEANANAAADAEKKPVPRYNFRLQGDDLVVFLMDVPINIRQFDAKSIKNQFVQKINEFVADKKDSLLNELSPDRAVVFNAYPKKGQLLISFNIDTAFGKDVFLDKHQPDLVNKLKDSVITLQGFTNVNINPKEVTKNDHESGLLMDNKYFELLGIERTAKPEDIEAAYTTKTEEYKNNVDKLNLLKEAYSTLTDENAKLNYESKLVGFVVELGDENTTFADIDDDGTNSITNPQNMMINTEKEVHLFLNPDDPKERGEGYQPRSVPSPFLRQEIIGQTIATDMQEQATWAIIISLLVIVIYIWVRFRNFKYGLGATIALAHDVMFALGAIAVFDALDIVNVKLDLTVIAALLTIIGYSLNDTIVVFDRIRENLVGTKKNVDVKPYLNSAINQTLSRTILTSFTTFVVVFILLLLGTQVLEGFAFTLFIGVIVGTYSSIFIASPILTANWEKAKNLILYMGIAGFVLGALVIWIPFLNGLPHIIAAPFLSMILYAFVFVGLTIWGYSWWDFFKTSVKKDDSDKKKEKKTESFTQNVEEPKEEEAAEEKSDEEESEESQEVEEKEEPKAEAQKQDGSQKGGSKGKKGGKKGKGKGKKKR